MIIAQPDGCLLVVQVKGQYDLYSVTSLKDIVGEGQAVARLERFAKDVDEGRQRMPLMVFGPPGTGKTAAVHVLAAEHGWNVVELNASDYRDKETIERRLVSASTSRTLFHKRNLILMDEIDELAPRFDKGASAGVSSLLANSRNPVIFIANDMWDQSISFLRGKTEPVEFEKLTAEEIVEVVSRLCKRASIRMGRETIEVIATRSNGDARSAINDVYAMVGASEESIEVIGLRDRKVDIFDVLDRVFMAREGNAITAPQRAMMNTDLTNEMIANWIDENAPKRYSKGELKGAFDALSDATMYLTRASRSQYYTYWRYAGALMSSGVALAKEGAPDTSARYSFPRFIKQLSASKGERKEERAIAEKLKRHFHSSTRKIRNSEMALLAQIARRMKKDGATKKEIEEQFESRLQLDGDEVEHIMNYS